MSAGFYDWQDDLDMGEWSAWEREMSGVEEFWTTDWTILGMVMVSVVCVLAVGYFIVRAVWS